MIWKLIEEKGNILSGNRRPRVGVFIGDPTGIGPEVTVKALSDKEVVEDSILLIIGDERAFKQGQRIAGFTLEYEDLTKAGVVDPTKVTRLALQNAASVAGLLLTTEAMVAEKPEKKKSAAPAMPPEDMY